MDNLNFVDLEIYRQTSLLVSSTVLLSALGISNGREASPAVTSSKSSFRLFNISLIRLCIQALEILNAEVYNNYSLKSGYSVLVFLTFSSLKLK